MSKTKTITPSMVKDWLIEMDDALWRILADIANGEIKPSELKEDISSYIDNERSSL
jgi:hypothetical protein